MRRLLGLVVAAVIFLAVGASSGAEESQPPPVVKAVEVEGNRHVQEAVILERIRTRTGSAFVPAQVSEDVRAIFALGFFDDVQVRVEELEGGIKLTFVVVERPFVRDIDVTGNRRLASAALREKIGLGLGTIYDPVAVQRAVEALRDHYEQEGYLEARVTPETERFPDGSLHVLFRIAEGRRFRIDRIVIEGARGLSAQEVKRAMQLRERRFVLFRGTVQRRQLERDLERIAALYQDHGYLRARVEGHAMSVDRDRGLVTIIVKVVEGPRFTVAGVDVAGATLFPVGEIRRQLRLAPGEVFSRSKLQESSRCILDLYGAIGRVCVSVSVVLEVIEGSEVVIERMTIPSRC